jgi:hypothetical protein
MNTEESTDVKALRKVRYPSSSASAKPRKKKNKKKTDETVRILGTIARGEL